MKPTGPACTEAASGAEQAGRRERAEGNAGGVRPSSAGESHPHALTDPYVKLSLHTALIIQSPSVLLEVV